MIVPPHGWDAICEFYSLPTRDEAGHVTAEWQAANLVLMPSPFPLRLSWEPHQTVTHIRCHKKIVEPMTAALQAVKDAGLTEYLGKDWGGCYADRSIRGDPSKLSLHALGAAIDWSVLKNPMGQLGDPIMAQKVAPIFKSIGWTWGGDFRDRLDPMHTQWGSGA